MVAQRALLVLVSLGVLAAAAYWLVRRGHWKRPRFALLTAGVVVGLLLLTRRVGWGELGVLAVLVLLPWALVGPNFNKNARPARPPPRQLPRDGRQARASDADR